MNSVLYNLMGLAFLLLALQNAECKVFTRCELAQELKKQGFPRDQLPNWVCLVESESGRNTGAVGKPNANGSVDFGLFQINDKYWCDRNKAGKDCNVKCSDLLIDDITLASNCAKKIFARHGYNAWYGWKASCQKGLPDLSSCGV